MQKFSIANKNIIEKIFFIVVFGCLYAVTCRLKYHLNFELKIRHKRIFFVFKSIIQTNFVSFSYFGNIKIRFYIKIST